MGNCMCTKAPKLRHKADDILKEIPNFKMYILQLSLSMNCKTFPVLRGLTFYEAALITMQLRTEFCLRETGMKYTRILWHTLSIFFFSKSTTFFVLKIIFALIIKLLLPPFLLLKLLPSSLSIVCRRQINKHTQIHGSTPTSHSGCAHSQNSSACATHCWFLQQQLWYQYFIMG